MSEVPVLVHLAVPSTLIAEHMLNAGYDGVVVDIQHGEVGVEAGCSIVRALPRTVAYPWVRMAGIDAGMICRVLDAGARGVIAPSVETADEARALVRACKYPPVGGRSLGPGRPNLYAGGESVTQTANSVVKAVVQIETVPGVEAAEDIMSVPGLDSIYVGPNDLALSYGLTPRLDWESGPVFDAIVALSQQARRHGLTFGVFCSDPEYALLLADRGLVDYVALGSDVTLVTKIAATTISTYRRKK
ncbi:MAG: aldolase/citrate lyase family protein [Propionibacteriaceae bacterium]|nr:aldolase/citrate lyase family protein [Propionibacteriaceae bacterium]